VKPPRSPTTPSSSPALDFARGALTGLRARYGSWPKVREAVRRLAADPHSPLQGPDVFLRDLGASIGWEKVLRLIAELEQAS